MLRGGGGVGWDGSGGGGRHRGRPAHEDLWTYLVERFVPASNLTALAAALARANFASRRVVHLGSRRFPATRAAFARSNHRRAGRRDRHDAFGLEFERVVEAALISGAWCGPPTQNPFIRFPTMRGDDR